MKSKQIKQNIRYKNLVIFLYDYKINDLPLHESNIEAFSSEGKLLWKAERTQANHYYEMQIDESNDTIEANDGAAMFYTIELKEGKIIHQEVRK
jgi:3'-phosphoadenosine 5'-phosphosulfate sulfotransferase (PAPS reductase)/FAD synthetase